MKVLAYAKINWALRIVRRREDGYHDLETLFQTISLHDTLTFTASESLSVICDDPSIPCDESNLVMRAARACGSPPVRIDLKKRIPAGGGLGGGSSDAAATLVALREMFGVATPLEEIAERLGSDVAFFLSGGTAYATGRGDVLTPLRSAGDIPLIVLIPTERIATAEAFRRVTDCSLPLGVERFRSMVEGGLLEFAGELLNDFEHPVFQMLPHLAFLKKRLYAAGAAWAALSGSGSCVVGAFRSASLRDHALGTFPDVQAVPAETLSAAQKIER